MTVTNTLSTTLALLLSTILLSACSGGSSGSSSSSESQSGTSTPQSPASSGPDVVTPAITATLPENDATGVPTSSAVFVTFDEPLDETSLDEQSLLLTDQGVPVPGAMTYDASNNRLAFEPTAPLATETVYGVTVAATIQDSAGNTFPGHDWFFTTGDSFNLGGTSQMTIDLCMDDGDKQMLTLVNNARSVSRDCGAQQENAQAALSWSCLLDQAALGHSTSMADNDFHEHVSPVDGSNPGDRITAVGYSPQAWGENIAAGYPDEEAVVDAWLASPGHCSNIMSGSFTELGAGYARNPASTYSIYWTQNFARPIN